MLYPVVDLEEWCKRFDLKIQSTKCHGKGCKLKLRTTIPFSDKTGHGLISPKCPCGSGGSISTVALHPGRFSGLTNQFAKDPTPVKPSLKLVPKKKK